MRTKFLSLSPFFVLASLANFKKTKEFHDSYFISKIYWDENRGEILPINDPEIFRRNGIEPTEKKILVLKSRGHFRAAYEPFSKQILEVDAPGLTTPNLSWFTYRNIKRPMWPFDKEATFG